MTDSERVLIEEIRKLQKIIAASSLRDMNQRQKIELLASVGLSPKDIAELVGTTSNTVSVALVKIRRQARSSGLAKVTEVEHGES